MINWTREAMNWTFDNEDNLIRVFRLPKDISTGFCIQPISVSFEMVDWFRPSNQIDEPLLIKPLKEFIRTKIYYSADRNFLIIARTGECFLLDDPKEIKNETN